MHILGRRKRKKTSNQIVLQHALLMRCVMQRKRSHQVKARDRWVFDVGYFQVMNSLQPIEIVVQEWCLLFQTTFAKEVPCLEVLFLILPACKNQFQNTACFSGRHSKFDGSLHADMTKRQITVKTAWTGYLGLHLFNKKHENFNRYYSSNSISFSLQASDGERVNATIVNS